MSKLEKYFINFLVIIMVVGVAAIMTAPIWYSTFGISTPTQDGQYAGKVVNIEHNKGLIFKTSQVYVKSGSQADDPKVFCVHERNQPEQLRKLRLASAENRRVTVSYHRPIMVPGWECMPPMPIADHVTVNA